jgi:hypothetical protein
MLIPGKPCVHQSADGCNIYPERPLNPCVKFNCGWLLEQETIPEFMKPSECGAIIMFPRIHGREAISAVPTGQEIPEATLEWLKAYARERSKPLVFCKWIVKNGQFVGMEKLGYGPPSFVQMVKMQVGPEDIINF